MLYWESHNGETQVTLYQGHVLDVLRQLPSESVHCVVTSPPYYGLRDYGLPPVVWGGDPECPHEWRNIGVVRKGNTNGRVDLGSTLTSAGSPKTVGPGQTNNVGQTRQHRVDLSGFCRRCGAWRGQLGLEPSPDLYVQHMVEVFREVRRVLRPEGTLWLNLGDTYLAQQGSGFNSQRRFDEANRNIRLPRPTGVKPKDLLGIPWAAAFALRADGWYLRSDIIIAKANPMPESVTDRPTRAHEYVFLMSKSPRYYYDADAIREPHEATSLRRAKYGEAQRKEGVTIPGDVEFNPLGRNKRSVWPIATEPFPDAHFAVMPSVVAELCILAGTPTKVCPSCGAPWRRRVVVRSKTVPPEERKGRPSHLGRPPQQSGWFWEPPERRDLGWEPGCECPDNDGSGRAVVLDPFVGAGTVALVAQRLGRSAIGIDLNPDYLAMSRRRIEAEHAQRRLPVGF